RCVLDSDLRPAWPDGTRSVSVDGCAGEGPGHSSHGYSGSFCPVRRTGTDRVACSGPRRASAPGSSARAVAEIPTPEPGARQILIRLRAAGMNPMDLWLASGAWKPDDLRGRCLLSPCVRVYRLRVRGAEDRSPVPGRQHMARQGLSMRIT